MKIKLIGLMVSLFLLAGTAVAQTFINLTPRPKSISVKAGQQLTLPSKFSISHSGLAEEEVNEVKRFADLYAAVTGAEVSVVADDADALFQVSKLDATSKLKDSGYTLAVTSDKVNIQAKSATGFFYAFQSVKKLLPANVMAGKKDPLATEHAIPMYTIPLVPISDEPRFDYRGFMLDVSRHFFTVDEVKRMLDVMSYYKMNAFHWHLTDDQGWRVEIKKYPKLTTVGSIAPNSLFTDLYEAKQYWINKPYGPYFYTQDEIRDVVAYAKERHITIVPEVDMPGHSSAAMASYPEYSCSPSGGQQVWSKGGISYDVINVANPAAVQFAKDVLSEIMDLFPGERIHIGGDEAPRTRWKKCPKCQARIRTEKLKADKNHTAEDRLQSYCMTRIEKLLNSKGRQIIGWDEILEGDVAPNATVMSWRGSAGGIKAAQLGHDVIMTPNDYCYFDYYQSEDTRHEPFAIGGFVPLEKVYSLNPTASLTEEQAKHILGTQANLWTEYIPTSEQVEYMVLPRMAALAEVQWTQLEKKDYTNFTTRLAGLIGLYRRDGLNYREPFRQQADSTATEKK